MKQELEMGKLVLTPLNKFNSNDNYCRIVKQNKEIKIEFYPNFNQSKLPWQFKIYFTSETNSAGFAWREWMDGKSMEISSHFGKLFNNRKI